MNASVRFEEAGARATSSPSDGSVLQAIRLAAMSTGIDPIAELYNEALELAQDGHYGQAQARLQVLLGLAPSDGESHLLLAKVLVAGQQWRRAIGALDEAAACGTAVPEELRAAILRNLSADEDSAEEQRKSRVAREQGEITRLRTETRRLRSENATFAARNAALEKEAARWAWIATGTSTVAILFILARMAFGGAAADPAVAAADPAAVPGAADPAVSANTSGDPASPRNGSLAEQAGAALMAAGVLDGAQLEVTVRGATAQLSGYSPTFAQLKKAQKVVEEVPGVEKVGIDGVIVLAKRDGARHIVKGGETLGGIAYAYYGKSSLHPQIVAANASLGATPQLKVGMELTIPPVRDVPAPAAPAAP
jgi:nucleoid-associated protein YgaU